MRYVFIALTALSCAFGDPITYTFTGNADGTIDGTNFTDAKLTVTASGDTSDVTFNAPNQTYFLNFSGGMADFTINGIGGGTFTDAYVFDNQEFGVAGFGLTSDIIQTHDSSIGSTSFASYNLKSAIGPLGPESSDPSTGDWVGLATSLGSLTVTSYDNVVFQATTAGAPEPVSVPILGVAIIGMTIIARRRIAPAK